MKHMTRIGALLTLAGLAGLTGCSIDQNSRSTIGAQRTLPPLEQPTAGSEGAGAGIATTRLDRGDWAAVEFRVPVDGTVHAPLWKSGPSFDDDHPRAHGLYPTAESALDLGRDGADELWLGVTEPVRALVDLAILPVRGVLDPAWTKTQSPSMYKRWRSGQWLAGPMPEATGDKPMGESGS
jgi:hypothetical protein